ncbi:SWI/SNF related-matrix-associated actin-dependent regulator of chromatin subfamily C [Nematocida minor]|uniref:SWI/SNF related-matrix-associated actin-dependent regulator of chromatin subfamily C n=1 Tax=Nematocida minor TaxID=1912983 RepID=UPI00221EF536|nr:SWI/SNF related-matrix-associated actin-dependent regulator of chromatin subfamily C [Nematocida minor]KAI5191848.1 SWI/SNF related-matrix-associated actin-dependent regulator of chromatin subfamily C [Nematocida minor]
MNEWSYKVDKAQAKSKMNVVNEVDKKVVNISNEPAKDEGSAVSMETSYPELFKVLDERNEIPILVPLHSAWFSTESVHPIERRFFNSYLENEEDRQKYVATRNTIFKMYQENTASHLSITECRRKVSEDVSTLIKIYSFLEHWGLINYKIGVKRDVGKMLEKIKQRDLFNIQKGSAAADAEAQKKSAHSSDAPVNTSVHRHSAEPKHTDSISSTHNNFSNSSGDSGRYVTVGESNIPAPNITPSVQKAPADLLHDPSKHFSLQPNGLRQSHIPVDISCTHCSKNMNVLSSEEKIYFSEKGKSVLCLACFSAGNYPSSYSYSDFHILEAGVIRQMWTEKEEMLLVEGIEMYKDDWKAVASYVKTKTLEQCVLHFLKMGIQDPFLEMEAISFSENKMPFNYSLNPVMSTVAFLASVVHPGVASAAAKVAVEEIHRRSQKNSGKEGWLNDRLNEIAVIALTSCLSRAQEQKTLEEGKKERLLELLVESEMKRVDLKVNEFTDLAKTLKKEREDLEKMRETYRKAHLETRKEIAEIVTKVRKICDETGKNFEEVFFKE